MLVKSKFNCLSQFERECAESQARLNEAEYVNSIVVEKLRKMEVQMKRIRL